MPFFAIAGGVFRDSHVEKEKADFFLWSSVTFAPDAVIAEKDALKKYKELNPPEEGWHYHSIAVYEIPADLMWKALENESKPA